MVQNHKPHLEDLMIKYECKKFQTNYDIIFYGREDSHDKDGILDIIKLKGVGKQSVTTEMLTKEEPSMIKALRIDERLIHGQVAVTWCSALNVDRIIVANDKAAKDEVSIISLKMAAPQNVKVAVKAVNDAIKLLKDPRMEKLHVLILVNHPDDALQIVKAVDEVPYVNVGNFGMLKKEGRNMLATSLAVTSDEIKTLKAIVELKPKSNYQMTPTLPPQELKGLL